MEHHFNVEVAKKYGVPVAIVLNHLSFWLIKNRANNKHYYDGRYWTYNSVKAFQEIFPYWTYKQMRLVLEKVKESGLIFTGNYNSSQYDQTTWYSLTDEGLNLFNIPNCPPGQIDGSTQANEKVDKGQPIPDNKTYNKTYIKSSCSSNDKKIDNQKPKSGFASVESQSNSYNPDSMNKIYPVSPLLQARMTELGHKE